MKNIRNSRRHMITAVCLIIGLVVLSTSVYANYDNANGYKNYKESLKNLLLYTDNVSLSAKGEFLLDGECVMGTESNMKISDTGMSQSSKEWNKFGVTYETYTYQHDGKEYRYYPEDNSYYEWDNSWDSIDNLASVDINDKTVNKAVRFIELGADLLIGDLKNNVVLLSNEDGIREYAVDVSRSQMPEIVNAGLSLIFTAQSNDLQERSYVTYEDWMGSCEAYFAKNGAEDIFRLWNYADDEDIKTAGYDSWEDFEEATHEEYERLIDEHDKMYQTMLDEDYNGTGVLLVLEDGSTEYYKSYADYIYREGNEQEFWYYMFGEDPYIDNAKMTVKLNEKNELIENYIEGTLLGVDANGEKHTATIKLTINASDYGTTHHDIFNPAGKEIRK